MTALELRTIEVRYPPSTVAVSGVDLMVGAGQLCVLLGPSGCGKTSTLRAIAGLVELSGGDVLFDGVSMRSTPPEKRGAVMVFQENALLPFRTAAANIEFGLKLKKLNKAERAERTAIALDAVQLSDLADRWPAELSSGQRQRVALARALAVEPRLLLLDEPLSSLDQNLRDDLGRTIRQLQRRAGITTVMVTHDQSEAVAMADTIGVMIDGRLRQVGRPAEVMANPVDAEVARFLGRRSPAPPISGPTEASELSSYPDRDRPRTVATTELGP